MDRLFRVKEASDLLAIGHTKTWELIGAGELRTIRIGERGVRIPESEISRFVRERVAKSDPAA
jgi:excisionase family DNA binding protein